LILIKIDVKEANQKISKIIGKTLVKGRVQLNLDDGRNIFLKKDEYKTGDSILIEIPSQKIISHFKFENQALIFVFKGKSSGQLARVENIRQKEIVCKKESGDLIETRKKYVIVVGKEKPAVTIIEK
jgi:small subunit ribosomal protein S4e